MSTIVVGSLAAEDFALARTLQDVEDVSIECERLVATGEETVAPLLWVRGSDEKEIRRVLDEDPTTTDIELLSSFEGEWLYRMEWVDRVDVVLQMITNSNATVVEAWTDHGRWFLRVLYPEREGLSKTVEFCEENGIAFEVEIIREMEGEPSGRYGLTDEQYDALTAACEAGYFSVPRESDLDELADQLGISHQALSERIRRGTQALVTETLLVGKKTDARRH
ncbi:helix-turn-helix domain-containing protein [Halomarina oriensis]|uniref:DNA-binding protein n=1 Tax=Halomarina oriensis TaxID=671145 RepID=A0A6B0GT05_9EURY|nr:helix-turn-helix domain-containing protein [Halomarina oriensis]MWG35255.1 DNA-binding protein [Halomarina oriensis]